MSSVVEETIKALVEFEAELDKAKSEASESKTRMVKASAEWAASAKATGISKAQQLASRRLAKARTEAESDAAVIKKKEESSIKSFEASISKRKSAAVEHVTARLLGESQ